MLRVYQVGSVGAFFSMLLASSLAEFDVLKRPLFLRFHADFASQIYGRVLECSI